MPVMAVNNEDQHKQAGDHRSRPRWSAGKKMGVVLRLLRGEGNKRHVTEIDATEVVPSLNWAIAAPEKAVQTRTADRGAERGQFNEEPPF
jgi:hypothetical protein